MAGKAKPAPRRRQRASGNCFAGQRTDQENTVHPRKNQHPGEISVYSGRNLDGWLQPRNGRWLAYAADGKFLGTFATDRLGASAIYQAHASGGGQ